MKYSHNAYKDAKRQIYFPQQQTIQSCLLMNLKKNTGENNGGRKRQDQNYINCI